MNLEFLKKELNSIPNFRELITSKFLILITLYKLCKENRKIVPLSKFFSILDGVYSISTIDQILNKLRDEKYISKRKRIIEDRFGSLRYGTVIEMNCEKITKLIENFKKLLD